MLNVKNNAESAIQQCAEKADKTSPDFSKKALSFLKVYAHKHDVFGSEEVVFAAYKRGIEPHDFRAWGWVFRKAAKAGYIERSPFIYKRRFGHGAPSQAWESLVFGA